MLELKNISFCVEGAAGQTEILQHVNLTVPDGKFFVITGPNGGGNQKAGKAN